MSRTRTKIGAVVGATVVATAGTVLLGGIPNAYANRVNATCNNTTTDAATINSAITSSSAGDEIVIKGPCLINATIKLLDDRTYRGDGRSGTILKQANGANLAAVLASDTYLTNSVFVSSGERIEKLTIDGNSANNTGTVGIMLRSWRARVNDVEIYSTPSDGIRVTNLTANGTTHIDPSTTLVNSTIEDSFIHDVGGSDIKVSDPDNKITDWVVKDNWLAGANGSGIALDNAAGWQIRNNHIYGPKLNAIDASRCFSTGINDNYIEDFGQAGVNGAFYFGIRCTVQGDVANVISGNKVNHYTALPANGTFTYIGIDGVNYGTGDVVVSGNAIVGTNTARETGLSFQKNSGPGLTVVSTGNLVAKVGTPKVVGTGVSASAGQ